MDLNQWRIREKKEFDETELNSLEEELKKYNNSDNYSIRLSQLTIEGILLGQD